MKENWSFYCTAKGLRLFFFLFGREGEGGSAKTNWGRHNTKCQVRFWETGKRPSRASTHVHISLDVHQIFFSFSFEVPKVAKKIFWCAIKKKKNKTRTIRWCGQRPSVCKFFFSGMGGEDMQRQPRRHYRPLRFPSCGLKTEAESDVPLRWVGSTWSWPWPWWSLFSCPCRPPVDRTLPTCQWQCVKIIKFITVREE